jgi:hypothetical protein
VNAIDIDEGNRRLLVLADFLEQLPPDRFNLAVWVSSIWQGREDLGCGAKACAMGWAATIPEFRALGLRLVRPVSPSTGKPLAAIPELAIDEGADPLRGFEAAAALFGLSRTAADYLFDPDAYRDPDEDEDDEDDEEYNEEGRRIEREPESSTDAVQVARRIRNFVSSGRSFE